MYTYTYVITPSKPTMLRPSPSVSLARVSTNRPSPGAAELFELEDLDVNQGGTPSHHLF